MTANFIDVLLYYACIAYETPQSLTSTNATGTYASLQQPSGPAVQVNSPAADAATAAGDYDGYEIPIPTYVHVAPPLPRDNAYETII